MNLPPDQVGPIADDKTSRHARERRDRRPHFRSKPASFVKGSPNIRRCFQLQKKSRGLIQAPEDLPSFPSAHSERDLRAQPWVARSLYKAFCESKDRAIQAMHVSNTLACTLPWQFAEMELLKSLFGADWWPYGVEPNRHLLETLIRYMGEQGLIDRPVKLDELFAPSISGEFKI